VKWRPDVRIGVGLGIAILLVLGAIDAGLILRIVRGPVNGVTFLCALLVLLSVAAMAVVGYRIFDLLHLRYEFDRNQLVIHTAATRHVVPLHSIVRVLEPQQAGLEARLRGLRWPGCYVGPGTLEKFGLTLFCGVTPPRTQAVALTAVLGYGLSVPDLEVFQQVFAASRQLGPTVEVHQQSIQASYVEWPIWRDRLAQALILAGILLGALLFAVLLFRYPGLPGRLPMHYDAAGQVDRIAPRSEAFDLPIIGLIAWLTNGILGALLYRRQRMLSYLAWSGTLIVQMLFLMALWGIVT
jgi:hypothetical protein